MPEIHAPDEAELKEMAASALASFVAAHRAQTQYRQYERNGRWCLAVSHAGEAPTIYGIHLLYTIEEQVPVAFEVCVDARPVARVGLTRAELARALSRAEREVARRRV